MPKNKPSNLKLYIGSLISLTLLFILFYNFVASKISLSFGVLTMSYLSISILLSVYFSVNNRSSVLSGLLVLAKAPVTILIIYLLSKLGNFEPFSFVVGVLIVLPSLVILSYRKL